MLFHKIFSSTFGIGYIKGGGSVAAAFTCLCWWLLWGGAYPPALLSVVMTVAITGLGVWSSTIMERAWGKDPSKVVVDEVAGMCFSLLFLPVHVTYLLLAFFLFRFFDIVKPLYIRKMETLPNGWGIMLDDVLAGIYTNVIIQTIVWFKLF
jgi:phosphatidylglycerophosphatase A